MNPVRAVTFDCWGTLITDSGFERAMARRVEAVAEECGCDEARASDLLDRAWREHHGAWLQARQYGSAGIARFCISELGIDDASSCARLTEALEEAGRLGSQRALDGAVDTLRMLRGAGVRTALVCDAGFTPGRIVRDFLAEHGLLPHLEYLAFSNEVGVPKPDPRIFRAALDAIDCAPEETVHVGDLLRTDIFGGRAMGMKTIRITQVSDDAARGFSWDPDAFGSVPTGPPGSPGGTRSDRVDGAPPFEDADEIVSHHAHLPDALRRLGTRI